MAKEPKPKKEKAPPKLDIFLALSHADQRDKDFYSGLTPDQQSGFSPLIAMRWMSIVPDSSKYKNYTLRLINEMMNVDFWSIKDHPELLWKLMALCGTGQNLRHVWINRPTSKKTNKVQDFMYEWYPRSNVQEINLLLRGMSRTEFEDFVKSTGCSDDTLKEIMTNYDVIYG